MKVDISVNFDFGKLGNEMPKIIEKYTQRYARSSEEGSKENIDRGVSPELKQQTINRRKRKGTGGRKPLFETGNLYRSIKGTSEGLVMLKYGYLHHIGDLKPGTPRRMFIETSKKTVKPVFDKFKQDVSKALKSKVTVVSLG
tara:strand:- start:3525 stop:3950 length:426 start_codon:yes stop_codon:yes gene_type:complete